MWDMLNEATGGLDKTTETETEKEKHGKENVWWAIEESFVL